MWRTLHSMGHTHYGAESGAVAVLHSWGQNLSLHPHLHCIVPAVGYSIAGEWKHLGHQHFLYPVHQLGQVFKGKFLDSLKRALKKSNSVTDFDELVQKAFFHKWVVYCEPSLASAKHVIRYLGQYTHRVAITNQRILKITDTQVTFLAKDYRNNGRTKPITLEGTEFLRRFCLHILPKGFVKIRRYGIYNPTTKRNLELQFVPEQKTDNSGIQGPIVKEKQPTQLTGVDRSICPVCKKGKMLHIREMPRARSPGRNLTKVLLENIHIH